MHPPEALILAGPNGAGKTTSSASLVPTGTRFLNVDMIAVQLLEEGHAPAAVDVAAGRAVLEQLRTVLAEGASFCIETNLAGRGFIRWIDQWRGLGYTVRLVYTALDSPELAVRRVAARVASGGHDVAEVVVRRRWAAGLRALFGIYLERVDEWVVLDSSDGVVREVALGGRAEPTPRVTDGERWRRLLAVASSAGATVHLSGG